MGPVSRGGIDVTIKCTHRIEIICLVTLIILVVNMAGYIVGLMVNVINTTEDGYLEPLFIVIIPIIT